MKIKNGSINNFSPIHYVIEWKKIKKEKKKEKKERIGVLKKTEPGKSQNGIMKTH